MIVIEKVNIMRIAFFDTKEYDIESFDNLIKENNIEVKYFESKLTEHNAKTFVYRYLTDGTLLTKDNIKSYIGKTVSLRSPMYCATPDGLCARCCGKLAEDQNIVNVGMHSLAIAETMVYVAMKAMHVSSVSLYTVEDINRFIIE